MSGNPALAIAQNRVPCKENQRSFKHIGLFADPQAKRKKPKEPIFCPRADELASKRTKSILKNEIIENFGLFWLNKLNRT